MVAAGVKPRDASAGATVPEKDDQETMQGIQLEGLEDSNSRSAERSERWLTERASNNVANAIDVVPSEHDGHQIVVGTSRRASESREKAVGLSEDGGDQGKTWRENDHDKPLRTLVIILGLQRGTKLHGCRLFGTICVYNSDLCLLVC